MAKKLPKIKFSGNKPENNIVKASLVSTGTYQVVGNKISFNARHSAYINTQIFVDVEKGYKLCFSVVPELAVKGMIAFNSPGNLTKGEIIVGLINCGREIVDIKNGDPIVNVWVEQIIDFDWESE